MTAAEPCSVKPSAYRFAALPTEPTFEGTVHPSFPPSSPACQSQETRSAGADGREARNARTCGPTDAQFSASRVTLQSRASRLTRRDCTRPRASRTAGQSASIFGSESRRKNRDSRPRRRSSAQPASLSDACSRVRTYPASADASAASMRAFSSTAICRMRSRSSQRAVVSTSRRMSSISPVRGRQRLAAQEQPGAPPPPPGACRARQRSEQFRGGCRRSRARSAGSAGRSPRARCRAGGWPGRTGSHRAAGLGAAGAGPARCLGRRCRWCPDRG